MKIITTHIEARIQLAVIRKTVCDLGIGIPEGIASIEILFSLGESVDQGKHRSGQDIHPATPESKIE